MIGILRNQHMRQQSRPGQAAIDRPVRRRRLHDPRATRATQLRPHCADHFEPRRNVFQRLRHVLAQMAQRAAAVRARLLLGRDRLRLARQVGRQRTARRLASGASCFSSDRRRHDGRRLCGGLVGFQIFQPQLELLDVSIVLFRTRAEVHALQLEDEQFQVLDLGGAASRAPPAWPAPAPSRTARRACRDREVALALARLSAAFISQICHTTFQIT